MNPGLANLLGIVSAGLCDRIDSVRVLESVDSTGYDSPDTERSVGYGRPIDDPELPEMVARGTAVFGDAVYLMGDALGVTFDEVKCVAEFAQTTELLEMDSWSIDAGCVAGIAASWQGWVGDRKVVSLDVRWRKGQTLEPDWPIEHGYVVEVAGPAERAHQARGLPAQGLRGHVVQGLHGARHDHDGAAGRERHPVGGRRPPRHRHLPRHPPRHPRRLAPPSPLTLGPARPCPPPVLAGVLRTSRRENASQNGSGGVGLGTAGGGRPQELAEADDQRVALPPDLALGDPDRRSSRMRSMPGRLRGIELPVDESVVEAVAVDLDGDSPPTVAEVDPGDEAVVVVDRDLSLHVPEAGHVEDVLDHELEVAPGGAPFSWASAISSRMTVMPGRPRSARRSRACVEESRGRAGRGPSGR